MAKSMTLQECIHNTSIAGRKRTKRNEWTEVEEESLHQILEDMKLLRKKATKIASEIMADTGSFFLSLNLQALIVSNLTVFR